MLPPESLRAGAVMISHEFPLGNTARIAAPAAFLGRIFAAAESFTRGREQQNDMAAALFHFCR
jgi:hypothetical protein